MDGWGVGGMSKTGLEVSVGVWADFVCVFFFQAEDGIRDVRT